MPNAAEEAELIKVIRRYVTPDRRYLKLGSALLGMTKRERAKFTRKLGQAASEVTPRELGILLDGGWRERKTSKLAHHGCPPNRLSRTPRGTPARKRRALCRAVLLRRPHHLRHPCRRRPPAAYLDRYLLRPDHLLRPGARHRRTPTPRHQTRCRSGAPVAYCATSREFPCVRLNPCPLARVFGLLGVFFDPVTELQDSR